MDKRDGARKALENFYKKQLPKNKPPRKNGKPEKQLAKLCMEWMSAQGWDMQIIESKNNYNPRCGKWVSKSARAGTADSIGTMPDGTFVAVEFKAPGKLKTFNRTKNIRQKEYIEQKIESSAFAVVTDSVARLEEIYKHWLETKKTDPDKAKQLLKNYLP